MESVYRARAAHWLQAQTAAAARVAESTPGDAVDEAKHGKRITLGDTSIPILSRDLSFQKTSRNREKTAGVWKERRLNRME